MTHEDDEQVMTVQEVATFLRVGPSTVYSLLRENRLKGRKVGGQWRVYKPVLVAYLEQQNAPAAEPELLTATASATLGG